MKVITALVFSAGVLAAGQQPRRPAQPAGAEPIEVLNIEKAWGGAAALMPLTLAADASVRNAAVRALGRLEDPRLIVSLVALRNISPAARSDAIAQSLKGSDPAVVAGLIDAALGWLHAFGSRSLSVAAVPDIAVVMLPLGRIAYSTPEQMRRAEEVILRITLFARPDPRLSAIYGMGLRAFESLARVNTKLGGLDDGSIAALANAVGKPSPNDSPAARFHALAALISARGLGADTLQAALADDDWQVRRLAVTVLAGAGGGLDDSARVRRIEEALRDRSANVRYEAVRAHARQVAPAGGCGQIVNMIDDSDPHVAVAALDALGDRCKADETVTTRVAAEARTPPAAGSWHRQTHAFVALAKRSPERAAASMEAFVTHPVWWVRMYAVRAAAAAGDLVHLEKLAYDVHDNVREAALEPLRQMKKTDATAAIIAALDRTDVQLLRTAARLLQEPPADARLLPPLVTALMRLTKDGKETSRDARLALLDAIAVHAAGADAMALVPLLRDFDPKIAERAAQILIDKTRTVALPSAATPDRGWPQQFANLRQCVVVQMATGGSFRMRMLPGSAPIAVDRFLKLATGDHYYDGLSIHRVVPNFVVQGGSPGANEYAGHTEYMRDEVGGSNVRGAVGLSTRGRNTGDAQFFVNLVDNPRLNYDYTVFASVFAEDMAVVDRIQEGDVMRSITPGTCAPVAD